MAALGGDQVTATVEAKLKADILAAIGRTANEDMKTVLLLTFGVFESLIARLDAMAADEQGLREAVLNGHAKHHDRDHNWIDEQIAHRHEAADERRWVRTKMAAEAEAIKDAKEDAREARNAVIRLIVVAVASSAASILGVLWLVKDI